MGTRTLRAIVGTTLFLTAIGSSVHAFNEPDGFRGVPWGATEEQMRAAVRINRGADIEAAQRWAGDRDCHAEFDLAGMPISLTYTFRGDRFVRVSLHFASSDFERIAAIFVERYGTPTHRGEDIIRWEGTSVLLELVNRSPFAGASHTHF